MSGPRYCIIPGDALEDARVTDLHLRVLGLFGRASDNNGWLQANQRRIAELTSRARETINRTIADLVEWGYVRKKQRFSGKDGRQLINDYQVVMDRDARGAAVSNSDDAVTEAPPCDVQITGGVTSGDHTPCDLQRSHHKNDPLLQRPSSSSPEEERAARAESPPVRKPFDELATVLDRERARAVVEHRQCLRKPLTPYAAKLLAGKFVQAPDPNAAADMMIANGWQSFDVGWQRGRGPPTESGKPRDVIEAARARLQEIERDDGRQLTFQT